MVGVLCSPPPWARLIATYGARVRATSFRITNLKSVVDSGDLPLGPITLFVGANNSGKSTLLRGLGLIQNGIALSYEELRQRTGSVTVRVSFEDVPYAHWYPGSLEVPPAALLMLDWAPPGGTASLSANELEARSVGLIANTEPTNLIYPYVAKRKVQALSETVNASTQQQVSGDLRNLVAKIDRVSNPAHPNYQSYVEMCQATLGFVVTTFASLNGKQAGIYIDSFETISLDMMGEGVSNLVGLISELCVAEGRIFLIEELENDVHPQALRKLLDIIVHRSTSNQFLVSTHNNIVVRHLGSAAGTLLYDVQMSLVDGRPTTSIARVPPEMAPRARLLEQLGYELADFDLWDAWLLLEESSAERLIRAHLIPWFVPGLANVRTLAVGGISKVEASFVDFQRLFLFTHLEERYRGRAWVVVDGDAVGTEAIAKLRARYAGAWSERHFRTWSQPSFEYYYPEQFQSSVAAVLQVQDKRLEAPVPRARTGRAGGPAQAGPATGDR